MTTTALRFQPIFINDRLYGMGLESLGFCLKKYETILGAFVFMPNHWHGVLWREGGFYLSGFMRDFKRFTSVQIRRELVKVGRADGFELGVNESDRKSYKIWQHRFDVVAINTPQVLETKIN